MCASRMSERERVLKTSSLAKQIRWIIVASAIVAVLHPAAALADLGDVVPIGEGVTLGYGGNGVYDGELTYQAAEIGATGKWADNSTMFTWSVSRPRDGGPLTYTYRFRSATTASTPGESQLSHFDLQVSSGGAIPAFDVSNPKDFLNPNGYSLEVFLETSTSKQLPSWWVSGQMRAIMFLTWDTVLDTDTGLYWNTLIFQSDRLPMWGLWEAKGGQDIAYNTASGETLVPDTSYVPLPGAVFLGMLGLTAAGLKLRRKA